MSQDYIYAVSRIRSREPLLLSKQDVDRLLSEGSEESAVRFLRDKGWGSDSVLQADDILNSERENLWSLMDELTDEKSVFGIFKIPNDYHNLKVAVKAATRGIDPKPLFLDGYSVEPDVIYEAVSKADYTLLPEQLRETAQKAMTVLLQTSDGQLCDIIIDAALLRALRIAGESSKTEIARIYCEVTVAAADIKIALRSAKTGKSREFLETALVECATLDKSALLLAALKGVEEICAYLQDTEYREAVSALKAAPSAFEKWCDDFITEKMQSQKYEYFSAGPLIAYVWARENEFKTVKLILSAKRNGIEDNVIRERMRNLYV